MSRVLRVAEVLDAAPEAVRAALATLPPGVRASVVATPAGQSVTLERDTRRGRRRNDITTLSDALLHLRDQLVMR